jgi:hypothetical protein
MIRKLIRIVAGSQSRRNGPEGVRGRLKLRPRMLELEGRTMLSTFTVNSTADDGSAGTLRWAIHQANANRTADTIVFSNLFASPQTINLTGKQLTLSGRARTTIAGPGENLLTVSGNNASRVFRITSGSSASLSGLTITGGSVNGNGGGVTNTGGTLVLKHVALSGNSARRGGGLFNDGTTILTDVVTHGNTARVGSGLVSTPSATLVRRGLSGPAATGPILNQTFSGSGFPSGWQKFLPGDVVESTTTFLTITDSTGMSAGIAANSTNTVPFNPVGAVTTITAQISSVSTSPQLGNAVFGLLGPNGPAHPSELAAGIDAQGHVFIVEFDPNQKMTQPTIVQVGVDSGYSGGPVTMTSIINSTGVQITAGSTKFRVFSFSKDLNNFSMTTAFRSGAIPALVAASQQGQHGGAASFESIRVSTAAGHPLRKAPAPGPRRSGAQSFSDSFNGSGGVPKNWTQILGAAGDVTEKPHDLTIKDSTGQSAGIASSTFAFNPQGVVTKMTAQISSASASPQLGNAVFGLIGPSATALAGELAAGIDGQGTVFVVVYDPAQKISQPTVVLVGVDKGYTGGPVTMTFTINSTGVQITAGSTKFRAFSFSKDLDNFSLKTAFPNGAAPALVGASQQGQKGGAASFASISVSTS